MDYKKVKTETTAITRQKDDFYEHTGNIYETVVVLSKRANQISLGIKQELDSKIEEFAPPTDNLEEVFDQMLTKIGRDLMRQIYNDLPELFSQENLNDLRMTKYKAELYLVTKEEALLLNQIKRRMRWHGDHTLTQEQVSQI